MRNAFLAAVSLAWLGAALVHGQEPPLSDSTAAPLAPITATPYPPFPDETVPGPSTLLDGTQGTKEGAGSKIYLSGDWLLWQTSKFPVGVPLVTAGTASGLGVIGQQGTTLLFGDQRLSVGTANGFRIMGGGWLTQDGWLRAELGGFFLQPQGTGFAASSNGVTGPTVLAQPFLNANTGTESSLVLAAPGLATGSVLVSASSQLSGAEANLYHDFVRNDRVMASFLLGVRYLNLSESLTTMDTINPQTLVPFGNTTASPGDTILVGDRFETHNNFLGPQFGGRLRYQWGILSADLVGKIGLGTTHASVGVIGNSTLLSPGVANQVYPGGLYALPSNGNGAANSRFAFVPEVGGNIGIQLLPGISVRVGYTFLYWSSVARAGQQINRNLDPNQIPASEFYSQTLVTGQPVFSGVTHGSYFAEGLNVGLEFRY